MAKGSHCQNSCPPNNKKIIEINGCFMKIAFDHQVFSFQEYGGVSRYVCNLAISIARQPDVEAKIYAPLHVNAYLADLPSNLVSGYRLRKFNGAVNKYISVAANKILVIPKLRGFRPDIVHETYYSSLAYLPKGARRVITVYDMIHEKIPGMSSPWRFSHKRKRDAVLRADHVVCISRATRNDLLEYIGVPEEKVSVVHLGFSIRKDHEFQSNKIGEKESKPYILYVGNRGGYKNFSRAICAYASSKMLMDNFKFVCFGGEGVTNDEMAMLRTLNISSGLVQFKRGGDELLAEAYANARVFIYPSLYEGFGLPPLEAMSYGCPVVCSNTSSIPEIVGDAGEYFDPNEPSSIRIALESVAMFDDKRVELIFAGYRRLSCFSWDKCANETLSIYQDLLC